MWRFSKKGIRKTKIIRRTKFDRAMSCRWCTNCKRIPHSNCRQGHAQFNFHWNFFRVDNFYHIKHEERNINMKTQNTIILHFSNCNCTYYFILFWIMAFCAIIFHLYFMFFCFIGFAVEIFILLVSILFYVMCRWKV